MAPDRFAAAIEHCQFFSNTGGAVLCEVSGAIISDSEFRGNTADYGAGLNVSAGVIDPIDFHGLYRNADLEPILFYDAVYIRLTGCLLSGNSAKRSGGAIYLAGDCVADIHNCTIAANSDKRSTAKAMWARSAIERCPY
ncbi:MAG: hypothetical protein V4587_09975 [Acidobacteriota bacterium]